MQMLSEVYSTTVTILNKLKAADSLSKQDVWYKTVIHNASWYDVSQSSVSGTTVNIGSAIKIEIPFNKQYKQYNDWKGLGEQAGFFTMSQGDYIIKGVVEEEVTSATVTKVVSKYEPKACTVRHIREVPSRGFNLIQLYIEGV